MARLSFDLDYEPPDTSTDIPCPECGETTLRIVGYDNYGADRDGRRGMSVPIYYCDECGYEES